MAIVNDNIFLEGLKGSVGKKMVIRRGKNGETVISHAPRKTDKEPTEAQKANKEKFKDASSYSKEVFNNPDKKVVYEADIKEGDNVYAVAMRDYMLAPEIAEIDASEYTGQANEEIIIKATDDFKVEQVAVSIYNPDGSLVEQGMAALNANKTRWIYKTTAVNTSLEGDKIVVRAKDVPGNKTAKEKAL